MLSRSGITKIAMTETLTTEERRDALAGEGSMLREQIQVLKAKEVRLMGDLRDTMRELESVRMRLEVVNNAVAKLGGAHATG